MTTLQTNTRVRVKGAQCIGRVQYIDTVNHTALVKWEGTAFVEDEIPINELEEVETE